MTVRRRSRRPMWAKTTGRQVVGAVAVLAAVAVVTDLIVGLSLWQSIDNLPMLYLLIVLAAAVAIGRVAALVASIAAVFFYYWLVVEPVGLFRVNGTGEAVALAVFLLTGLVTGQLAWALRARAEQARRSAAEALTLLRLTEAIAHADRPVRVRQAIVDQARSSFEADWAGLIVAGHGDRLILSQAGDSSAVPAAWPDSTDDDSLGADRPIVFRGGPGSGDALVGRVGLGSHGALLLVWSRPERVAPPPNDPIWRAFRDQAVLALDRAWLARASRGVDHLRQQETLQSALFATVSHELRTPLAAIKALAGSLRDRTDAATRGEIVERIDHEADRLGRIVENLLDYSRIEAGVLQSNKDWYAVDELVREIVDRYTRRVPGALIEVEVTGQAIPAELDDVQIDQVLTNLLDNARRHSPPGESVRVRVETEAGGVRVDVLDRGPGVAPEDLPHLFEPFYRGRNRATGRGLGLGLAICRGLIEAHGGRIWAENRATGGTRVSFRLPAPAELKGASAFSEVQR